MLCDYAVETERHDDRNKHGWHFQGKLVELNPGAGSWEDFPSMNVEVYDSNIFRRLQKDLIDHQCALPGRKENDE
jgi:hypothetical protein